MTTPYLNVNVRDEDESKSIIMHESLSDNFSTYISKSKRNIFNEHLWQKISANVSENTITELKDKYYK